MALLGFAWLRLASLGFTVLDGPPPSAPFLWA